MKVFVLAALIAFAAARPASSDGEAAAETVAEEYEANPEDGTYKWSYKTSNGIERIESGAQKQITPEDAGMTQQGQWSYQAPDGTEVVFKFTADENGYQPDSALLPVPPPMPAYVVKLLESIARRAKA